MTEPTYTEAEIREAILNVSNILLAENVIAHLKRLKHDFAVGQVITVDAKCALAKFDAAVGENNDSRN